MKVIKNTYLLLSCVFLAWFLLSWLDVAMHTITPDALNNYNAIVLTFNFFDNLLKGSIF